MQSLKAQYEKRGVSIVIVSFAEPGKLVPYQRRHQWPFTILADPQRTAYDAFALTRLSWWRLFSPSTVMLYLRLMREGKQRQDYGRDDIYQAGGDFILDHAGNVLFAHRSREPADRPSAAELLTVCDKILGCRPSATRLVDGDLTAP